MSIYGSSAVGTATNKITFNNYGTFPLYRVISRAPQRRQIRELDIPIPFESGISDFETLIGQSAYIIEGIMYPGGESDYDLGLRSLRKLASLDVSQEDILSDDGYVPYLFSEFNTTKQIFVKVLYVDIPENTRKGLVQPFRLICKVKDPTIYGGTAKQASTQGGSPVSSGTYTNLITNPSLEVDTVGWAVGGTVGASIERSTVEFYVGVASLKLTTSTALGNQQATINLTGLSIGATYAVQMKVKGTVGQKVFGFTGFSGYSDYTEVTLVSGWNTLRWNTVATGTSGTLEIGNFYIGDVYIDAVLVESGSGYVEYFDGATTDTATNTYAWTGTANASTSTRTLFGSGTAIHPFSYPIIYGASTSSVTTNADNVGDVPVYPISINIHGPVNSPKITNESTGEYIQVITNLATTSNELVISYDKDSLRVEKDGNSVLNLVSTASTFFKLQPGGNIISLTGTSIGSGAYATLSYYDGFGL